MMKKNKREWWLCQCRRIFRYLIPSLLVCLSLTSNISQAASNPLPADQAFALSVSLNTRDHVMLNWAIAPGYHLYRKQLDVTFPSSVTATIAYPQGELKYDALRGRYEAFLGSLIVPVTLATPDHQVAMKVNYQGCSEEGFCYPPMTKSFNLNLQTLAVTPIDPSTDTNLTPLNSELSASQGVSHSVVSAKINSFSELLTNQQQVSDTLKSQHIILSLLIFLGLGLLLSMTPCVLPMIPILTSIIAGSQSAKNNTRHAFFLSLSYVLGTSLTYALAGVLAAVLGSSLQVWLQQPWVIGLTGILFLALALSLFGLYELRLPQSLHQRMIGLSNRQTAGNLGGVFVMGMISALIVSPCVTAPLIGVLMYITESGSLVLGATVLFTLSIGMGIPLLCIGTSAGRWLPKSGPWMQGIKIILGLLMIAMAIGLFYRIWPTTELASRSDLVVVRSTQALKQAMAKAQTEKKPVVLDFYADWCAACLVMEKKVLSQPLVKQALRPYVFIRADLTRNAANEQALMKAFGVFAPPSILFFDHTGREIPVSRIVGELSSTEFLTRVKTSHQFLCQQQKQSNQEGAIPC